VQDAGVTTDRVSAIEAVWRADGTRLWHSLTAFTGDREVASDSMAEAFAQALGRGDGIRDPAAWVWKASFKIAAGEMARRSKAAPSSDRSEVSMPEPVADLVSALRSLSPNQRAAAILSWYADLPTKEVASILGCSAATVRVHLAQARRRLRARLEADDD
jgi:RNA polymerase sigma-70 factor (ECF subfamily)